MILKTPENICNICSAPCWQLMQGQHFQMDNLGAEQEIHMCQNWAELLDFRLPTEILLNGDRRYKTYAELKNKLQSATNRLTEKKFLFLLNRRKLRQCY